MLQEPTGNSNRFDPKAVLARTLAGARSKPKTTGFGSSLTSALKQTAGALISPVATVADVVAAPIEKVTGTTLFRPEDIGSFNLLQSGGRATEHVAGDVKELGRSVITGQDTLSQSPTARAYQQAGGGLAGAMAAATPYLELAGYVAPLAKISTGAARAAAEQQAVDRLVAKQLAFDKAQSAPPLSTGRLRPASPNVASATIEAPATSTRPTIYMNPRIYDPNPPSAPSTALGTSAIDDGSFVFDAGLGRLGFGGPDGIIVANSYTGQTPRPGTFADVPAETLSQRDLNLLRYNPLEETSTPDQLIRNLEIMSKNRNPVTTQVDWATADPTRDVDLTRIFRSELDAQTVSPDAATVWTAQTAAKQGAADFLVRNGLQSKLIANAPSYVNLRGIPAYIATLDWPTLMTKVPELRDYYVSVMRSYGIGL